MAFASKTWRLQNSDKETTRIARKIHERICRSLLHTFTEINISMLRSQVQEILARQKQPRGDLETEEARSILALFFFVV
jgi:hypothetical protein